MDSVRARDAVRWLQLVVGLFGWGVAVPLMIRSGLGLGPWDAFHVGINNLTGISVGMASILVGLVIVLASLPLGVRPMAGTVANMILIGVFIDLVLPWVPEAMGWSAAFGYYAVALVLVGLGTGMYIGAGLGSGPRDGLMLGLSARRGWPVRRVRFVIEMSALAAGWAMGGPIGVGTILFAVAVGPAVQLGLQLFGALPGGKRGREDGRTGGREDLGHLPLVPPPSSPVAVHPPVLPSSPSRQGVSSPNG